MIVMIIFDSGIEWHGISFDLVWSGRRTFEETVFLSIIRNIRLRVSLIIAMLEVKFLLLARLLIYLVDIQPVLYKLSFVTGFDSQT